MNQAAALLLLLLTSVSTIAEDWSTTDGKKYEGVTVVKIEDDTVTILDKDGGARVPLSTLSVELQKRFNYDPVKAQAAARKHDDEQKLEEQQLKSQLAAQAKAKADALAEDWTLNGKDYHNVKVTKVEDDTVSITYDGGIGRFPLADLTPDLQKRFNYAPATQQPPSQPTSPKNELEFGGVFNIPWGSSQKVVLDAMGVHKDNLFTLVLSPDEMDAQTTSSGKFYVESVPIDKITFRFFHDKFYQVTIKFDQYASIIDPTTGKPHVNSYLDHQFLFNTINQKLVVQLGTPYNVDKDHLQNIWASVNLKSWASLRTDMSGTDEPPVLLIYYNSELYGQLVNEQTPTDGKDSNDKTP